MSFIANSDNAKAYAPGYFLADDENCVRKTYEMAANSGIAGPDGGKYIPMGTIYPDNTSSAIGIVYEDVDVSTGNMPGSVVVQGTVYEDKLPVTGAQYDSVTLKDLVSPKEQGWQERSGSSPNYTYADSTDTTVNTSKTYYLDDDNHTEVSDYAAVLNPKSEGWYERSGSSPNYVYTLSTDTTGDKTKTYYEKSDIRIASAAKSALEAKGFTFVTVPAVTRPNWTNG